MDLTGKCLLVTGGSSGVGRAIAFEAAEQGAAVVNADLRREPRADGDPTDEVVREGGGEATFVETDVTDLDAVRAAVDEAERFGGVDIVVNNAGRAESYAIDDTTDENWHSSVAVNLTGVYHGCRAGIEALGDRDTGGAIVNVASVFGVVGAPNSCSYSAAKGGVISLTRQLARDYAADGIRVNAVSPGFVETPMLQQDTHDGTRQYATKGTAMQRIGEPEEVAAAVVFLASDAASFVTGQNLVVDGGFTTK